MGQYSAIEWTTHTFNPWWGCAKVSEACRHCYAEAWSRRVGLDLWGVASPRRFFGEAHWNEPRRWNEIAKGRPDRPRVFCASMADVFESRPELDQERKKLWTLISDTPRLDWLLLSKRPENMALMLPASWQRQPLSNVWLGVTAEDQAQAEVRIPQLLSVRAAIHFVSCEPLLGPVDLDRWLAGRDTDCELQWVIAGGESGASARVSQGDWFRGVRDQCARHERAFLFKQWGTWGLRGEQLVRLGKKSAGRTLDGRTWDAVPVLASDTDSLPRMSSQLALKSG